MEIVGIWRYQGYGDSRDMEIVGILVTARTITIIIIIM